MGCHRSSDARNISRPQPTPNQPRELLPQLLISAFLSVYDILETPQNKVMAKSHSAASSLASACSRRAITAGPLKSVRLPGLRLRFTYPLAWLPSGIPNIWFVWPVRRAYAGCASVHGQPACCYIHKSHKIDYGTDALASCWELLRIFIVLARSIRVALN